MTSCTGCREREMEFRHVLLAGGGESEFPYQLLCWLCNCYCAGCVPVIVLVIVLVIVPVLVPVKKLSYCGNTGTFLKRLE